MGANVSDIKQQAMMKDGGQMKDEVLPITEWLIT